VAVAEQSYEETPDKPLLSYYDTADFLSEGFYPVVGFLDTTIEFLDGWIHKSGLISIGVFLWSVPISGNIVSDKLED
jgi:hypothetical protein